MRASPYDLSDLGYPPVRIETAEGRASTPAPGRFRAELRRYYSADRALPSLVAS